jgi:alpha-galactosidase
MKKSFVVGVVAVFAIVSCQAARATAPTAGELGEARRFAAAKFAGARDSGGSLFSFTYGGKPSAELLGTWELKRASRPLDAQRTEHTLTYSDPKTGLVVACRGVEFRDFPAVEWVLRLRNTGKADTPILEGIEALDAALPVPKAEAATLYWSKGGVASFDDFAPQQTTLKPGDKLHLQPGGGRSSNQVLPFFNVGNAAGGVVLAVGWSGEWAADFAADAQGPRLRAGMARTHLVLHPGEEIRTPRMLLLFYDGDRWRGQNLLRQFVLNHHRPQRDGKPLVAPITWGNWGGTTAAVHQDNIQNIIRHELPIDYYWIDAGWYGNGDWAANVGNWVLNKGLYPDGFRPLANALEQTGRHLMLWLEPERVYRDTSWYRAHRDWLLGNGDPNNALLNLGDPAARQFVTDFISNKIDEFQLGCYRQDYNIDPLGFWQAHDAENRQGITESRYIEGLYAFWDALLTRHPKLIIDNCASGGRRIDIETAERSTPFWRTDGPRDAVAHQCHSYGLFAWLPLSATSQDLEGNTYEFRSSMSSALCVNWFHSGDGPQAKLPANFPYAWAKQILAQYLQLRPFYYGDYYPLTSYSQDRAVWMAWQFDRPEQSDGMVQAFRRDESPYEVARLKLHALEPGAVYTLSNLDTGSTTEATGRQLAEHGLSIAIKGQPGSAVIIYKKRP